MRGLKHLVVNSFHFALLVQNTALLLRTLDCESESIMVRKPIKAAPFPTKAGSASWVLPLEISFLKNN